MAITTEDEDSSSNDQVIRVGSVQSGRTTISSASTHTHPHQSILDPAIARTYVSLTAEDPPVSPHHEQYEMETLLRPVRYRPGSVTANNIATTPPGRAGTSNRDFGSRIGITPTARTARQVGDTYNHGQISPITAGDDPLTTKPVAQDDHVDEEGDLTHENRQVIQNIHRRTALVGGDIRTPTRTRTQLFEDGAGSVDLDAVASTSGSQGRSPFAGLWSLLGIGKKKERSSSTRRSFRDYSGSCFSDSQLRDAFDSAGYPATTVRVHSQAQRMPQFPSLDGAWSPQESTSQFSDLNKPLPLSPKDCLQRCGPHKRAGDSPSPEPTARDTNASNGIGDNFLHFRVHTVSTSPSLRPRGKNQFETITRDLLHSQDMEGAPELPRNDGVSRSASQLEPTKFKQHPAS
jgi:hypothetical protein